MATLFDRTVHLINECINDGLQRLQELFEEEGEYYEIDPEIMAFNQTWPNTSCGFGGISGQAFTTAMTAVVLSRSLGTAVVYHNGKLAYYAEANEKFFEAVENRNLPGKKDANKIDVKDVKLPPVEKNGNGKQL